MFALGSALLGCGLWSAAEADAGPGESRVDISSCQAGNEKPAMLGHRKPSTSLQSKPLNDPPAEAICLLSFLSCFLSEQGVISEPTGVAKMTGVMKRMICVTVYRIPNTCARHALMSLICQQPCWAYHPKENVFERESRYC